MGFPLFIFFGSTPMREEKDLPSVEQFSFGLSYASILYSTAIAILMADCICYDEGKSSYLVKPIYWIFNRKVSYPTHLSIYLYLSISNMYYLLLISVGYTIITDLVNSIQGMLRKPSHPYHRYQSNIHLAIPPSRSNRINAPILGYICPRQSDYLANQFLSISLRVIERKDSLKDPFGYFSPAFYRIFLFIFI